MGQKIINKGLTLKPIL